MDEAGRARAPGHEGQIERLVADIIARIDRAAACQSGAIERGLDLCCRKAGLYEKWRSQDDLETAGLRAGSIGMQYAHPVQGSRLDADLGAPPRQAEMQNRIGRPSLKQGFEPFRNFLIGNGQNVKIETYALPRQALFVPGEQLNQGLGRVLARAGKTAKAGHKDAKALCHQGRSPRVPLVPFWTCLLAIKAAFNLSVKLERLIYRRSR